MENVVFFAGQEQMNGVELEPITFEGEQSSHEHQQELQALMLGYNQSEHPEHSQAQEDSPSSSAESRTSDASVEADIDEKEDLEEIDTETSGKQEIEEKKEEEGNQHKQPPPSPPSAENKEESGKEEESRDEGDAMKKRKKDPEQRTMTNTTGEADPSSSHAIQPNDPPGPSDAMEVDEWWHLVWRKKEGKKEKREEKKNKAPPCAYHRAKT